MVAFFKTLPVQQPVTPHARTLLVEIDVRPYCPIKQYHVGVTSHHAPSSAVKRTFCHAMSSISPTGRVLRSSCTPNQKLQEPASSWSFWFECVVRSTKPRTEFASANSQATEESTRRFSCHPPLPTNKRPKSRSASQASCRVRGVRTPKPRKEPALSGSQATEGPTSRFSCHPHSPNQHENALP